jgi:DNA polymerase-3 subunit epsilon
MDEPRRRLNPRTIALIRDALAERHAAPNEESRPLALIPVAMPVATAPVSTRPRVEVPLGATPTLPGLELPPGANTLKPLATFARKSAAQGAFRTIEQPDTPLCDVVVVDTETTGAGPDARLVELGALRVRDGKVVEQFQTLVDPEMHIPAYVVRIHGITDAMVKGAPRARHVLAAFNEFVGRRALLAHNAAFDRRILTQEMQRVAHPRPQLPMFCTLRLSRKIFPDAPNHTLSTLARYLRIPDPPAHRALADCLTTVGVFAACAARHPLRSLHVVHGGATML